LSDIASKSFGRLPSRELSSFTFGDPRLDGPLHIPSTPPTITTTRLGKLDAVAQTAVDRIAGEDMQSRINAKIFGDKEDPRRRIEELFGESADPQKTALTWAADTLREAGVDPLSSEAAVIACLRKAEPKLTLKTASYLVSRIVSR
jgi:hypothetical protein